MSRYQAAIIALPELKVASRAVLAGSPVQPLSPEALVNLPAAIHVIENGDAETVVIRGAEGLVLREQTAAFANADPCYALITNATGESESAERFDSTIAAALSLFYRVLPGRRPWLSSGRRQAIVGANHEFSFLLTESEGRVKRPATTFSLRSTQLITLSGDTEDELSKQLDEVARDLAQRSPLENIAGVSRSRSCVTPGHRLGIALVAATPEGLVQELERARSGIRASLSSGKEWRTPAGSCFTPEPLGRDGVAFVFPGVGSPYPGAGADLFGLAPELMDRFEHLTRGQARRYLNADEIYPPDPTDRPTLTRDVVRLGECAMSISAVLTMFFRDFLGVSPRSALGYSFGEAIMISSLGIWPDPIALTGGLDSSDVFRSRLQGPMSAIREHWSLPARDLVRWTSYTVRATPAQVFEAIRTEQRVYLSIVNSPEEVILSGDEQVCDRILSHLGCPAVRVPIALTVHCEAARSEFAELARIHTLATVPRPEIALFSSSGYQPIEQISAALAQAIADGYTKRLDFPRLVRRAYADGARVFLELGPRRNCSTWIEKTLRGRQHAAIPCDSQGLNGHIAILRALARLFTHRVRMNLEIMNE